MASNFHWDAGVLERALGEVDDKMDRALYAVAEYHAQRAESYMRTNARWTDRTTNARNGLSATAVHGKYQHAIVLYHRVPYGIWLEVRWEGKFAIILPTIAHEGKEVMLTVRDLFRSLK